MGRRTYTTKTIMVNGSRIDVRQVAFKGDERVSLRVAEVVRQARRWLLIAVEKTNASGFTRDIKAGKLLGKFDPAVFRHFFLQEPTPGVLTTVWRNLARILRASRRALSPCEGNAAEEALLDADDGWAMADRLATDEPGFVTAS